MSHTFYVAVSYIAAFAVSFGLVAWVWLDHRARQRVRALDLEVHACRADVARYGRAAIPQFQWYGQRFTWLDALFFEHARSVI